MTTSASCIKILLVTGFILLAGCSSQPSKDDGLPATPVTPINPEKELKSTTSSEIEEYKQAMRHLKDGELDKSREILMEFIQNRPSLAGPWANLGLIYIKQNKLNQAEEAITKALKRNPKQAHSLCLLGYLESKKGNLLVAKKHYLEAIKHKSNYPVAHYNLALIYDVYFQDIAKAVKHYSTYLKLTGNKDKKTRDWVESLKRSLKKG